MPWYSTKTATTVVDDGDGWQACIFHQTKVVRWNVATGEIILNSGGFKTATTKTRMNEVAKEYGLNFQVHQKNKEWEVTIPNGQEFHFCDNMKFNCLRNGVGWASPIYEGEAPIQW